VSRYDKRHIEKVEQELARARDELERMLRHREFHSDEAIEEKRGEVRILEDILRIVRGEDES
jgi:hypothetical protein